MTLATESTYLPSSPTPLALGSWLVLAPHPDDETFGMGGTLLLAKKAHIEVDVIFLTDGSASDANKPDLVKIREQEATKACKKLGINEVIFWREVDRKLTPSTHLIQKLSAFITERNYASVFFPSPQEPHPDHRTTAVLAWESLRNIQFSATPISYDISVQGYTNQLIDITKTIEKKATIMNLYASQMSGNHYVERILGLNQARAWSLPRSVSHAEAFYHWPKEDRPLNSMLLAIANHHVSIEALPNQFPQVSVITRTQNRPEFLREAIRSVAGQTYTNIELIVINDGGEDVHTLVKEESIGSIQKFHYQLIETPTGRSYAANQGLKLCTGKFIIFLDDDDYFLPEHLTKLVHAAHAHPETKVIYTGVQCVDQNKALLETQFASPFNSTRLLCNNFIPIHAALFSKDLLKKDCQFDESFTFYEDWDFWLQASTVTGFLFIEGFSAIYRINPQSGFGVNADTNTVNKASLKIFKKWFPTLNDQQMTHLMGSAGIHDIKEQKIQALNHKNTLNDKTIFDKETHIQNQNQQLLVQQQKIQHQANQLEQTTQNYKQQSHQLEQQFDQLLIENHKNNIQQHALTTLEETLVQKNNDLAQVHHHLALKHQELDALYRSSSWLMTKPLRLVKDLYLYSKQRLQKIPPIIVPPEIKSQPDINDYTTWVARYDTLDDTQRNNIRQAIKTFAKRPLISIVMPTYKSPLEYLEQAILSIQNQLYPYWELCIADDASDDPQLTALLQQYANGDSRIKITFRSENGHISVASNSALALATGEFIALVDHDDLIPEHALFWVIDAINKNPTAALIYSDEDKLSEENGTRINPYFKSDWNHELFLGHNMISHLGVYKTDIMRDIGGFRVEFEGSQDYDLALRFIEKISPEQIIHIPKVLYHWRILNGSVAKNIDTKPYASIAAEKAVNEHLQRCKLNAHVKRFEYGHRLYFDLPQKEPFVSIIIPTRNAKNYVQKCIESLYDLTTYKNFEVILIDNGSDQQDAITYFAQLAQVHENFRIIRDDRPFNYSAQNNLAVSQAEGEFIALLNNDTEIISPNWLSEMVSIAVQPNVGAVGAKLLYDHNVIQHAGVILGLGGCAGHSHHMLASNLPGYFGRAALTQSMSAVTAACLVVQKDKFLEAKGLNEKDLTIAFNDVDLCLKLLELGYRNIYTPFSMLYHHESVTRGLDDSPQKQERFIKETQYMQQKWPTIIQNDPAYNVNLTLNRSDYSLAWPPREIVE